MEEKILTAADVPISFLVFCIDKAGTPEKKDYIKKILARTYGKDAEELYRQSIAGLPN